MLPQGLVRAAQVTLSSGSVVHPSEALPKPGRRLGDDHRGVIHQCGLRLQKGEVRLSIVNIVTC